MIALTEKARLFCDEDGCDQSLRVELVLLGSGGFRPSFPPSATRLGWECRIDTQNPMMPYRGCCPTHARNKSRLITPASALS